LSKTKNPASSSHRGPEVHRQSEFGFSALDALVVGLMVIDAERKLLFANATAGRFLAARRGLGERNGILRAEDRTDDATLQRAVDALGRAASQGPSARPFMMTLTRVEGRPLSLMIVALHGDMPGITPVQPAAMIMIDDPQNRPRPGAEALSTLWNLTPAEARLTAALASGERLDVYAGQNNISVQTAKTHLKRVFGKAGVTRQSDLIREVLMNPVLWLSAGWPPRYHR
jgi:DNA-binding CsgD family transcriptional regulator